MPGGDRTGPAGRGPMTGRGLGYCAGYPTPGYTRGYGMGLGRGWGRGRGRGYGRWGGYRDLYYEPYALNPPRYVPVSPIGKTDQITMLKQEKDYLESEMEGIKNALSDISKRIEDMEKEE
jgi:hypothetical protein